MDMEIIVDRSRFIRLVADGVRVVHTFGKLKDGVLAIDAQERCDQVADDALADGLSAAGVSQAMAELADLIA